MDAHVKTRWTADGLVEITLDALSARLLHDLVYGARREAPFDRISRALGHTLDHLKPEEQQP